MSAYLLRNGFQLASRELLAECREKSIAPPVALVDHFSNPAKFEHIQNADKSLDKPTLDNEISALKPNFSGSELHSVSPNPSLSDQSAPSRCNQQIRDNDNTDKQLLEAEESKGLLRFQLREAQEEIEKLKSKINSGRVLCF